MGSSKTCQQNSWNKDYSQCQILYQDYIENIHFNKLGLRFQSSSPKAFNLHIFSPMHFSKKNKGMENPLEGGWRNAQGGAGAEKHIKRIK